MLLCNLMIICKTKIYTKTQVKNTFYTRTVVNNNYKLLSSTDVCPDNCK